MADEFGPFIIGRRIYGSGAAFGTIGQVAKDVRFFDDPEPVNPAGFEYSLGQTTANNVVVPYNNVSIGGKPYLMGTVADLGTASDVIMQNNYAYVASSPFGLVAVDVSNPSNPVAVGTSTQPFSGQRVAVLGNRAAIAATTLTLYGYRARIRIFDLSNPAKPMYQGGLDSDDSNLDIRDVSFVSSQLLCAAGSAGGLQVIDLSDPTVPRVIGTAALGYSLAVSVSGSYAFVADYSGVLQVVNLSDPAHPSLVTSVTVGGAPLRLSTHDNRLYVGVYKSSTSQSSLQAYDISNPTSPQLLGSVALNDAPRGLTIDSTHSRVYVAAASIWHVVDVSTPMPTIVATVPRYATDAINGIAISGHTVYTTQSSSGLATYDVNNPASPIFVTSLTSTETATALSVSGRWAVSSVSPQGLRLIDMSDVTFPKVIDRVNATDSSVTYQNSAISGNYVFVAAGFAGLEVLNLLPEGKLQHAAWMKVPWISHGGEDAYTVAVKVSGTYAYVMTPDQLVTVDISNPSSPSIVGTVTPGDVFYGICISGNYLYASLTDMNGTHGTLKIYSLAVPSSPGLVSTLALPGLTSRSRGVTVDPTLNRAYVSVGQPRQIRWSSVEIINVSDKTNPSIIGSISGDYASQLTGVAVAGSKIYINDTADRPGGTQMLAYDISNISAPSLLTTVRCFGSLSSAIADSSRVYLSDGAGKVDIIHP